MKNRSDRMQICSQKSSENVSLLLFLSRFVIRSFFISILCLLCFIFVFIVIYFGDRLLNVGNDKFTSPLFSTYVIVSPSMVPTIGINDAIVVKRMDNDKYNIGDIITFSSSDINYMGLTITHRIVNKENVTASESIYTTKGDNNPIEDPAYVKTDAIYGKVLFKIPYIGNLKTFFSKPINYFLCLIVPSIIFIVYECIRVLLTFQKKNAH